MNKFAFALIAAPFVLSACSGGGSSNGGNGSLDPVAPTAQMQAARALSDTYADASVTTMASMPVTGSANYSGAAVFGNDLTMDGLLDAPQLTADVALTADFASGSMTGGMDNFHTAADEAVAGALSLSGGVIAGNSVAGDLAGTVGARAIDAQMAGRFLNDGAQAVSGTVVGTDSTGAYFGGGFIADQ